MSSQGLPSGVFSPVLTPFAADMKIHGPRYVEHCRNMLANGVGLAIFGTNSEANSLSLGEKRHALDLLLSEGLDPAWMMPGTAACSVPESVELTQHAVSAGSAGVLMLPPFYYKGVSDEGLFRYFSQVIEKVGDTRLRVFLYHIPPVTQVGISHALIERLLKRYPNVIAGIKDSGGDWENTASLIRNFSPEGFQVFAGTETVLLDTLKAGGAGCITATANVNPKAIMHLYRNWQTRDAPQQQARINATRAAFQAYPLIPAMKAAIAWQTETPEWSTVRPPLVELNKKETAQLRAALNQNENI